MKSPILLLLTLSFAHSWIHRPSLVSYRQFTPSRLFSTPFEADLYDDNEDENDTPISWSKVIIGVNKYSHDTGICVADAQTGQILLAQSKERITRKKHDAGNIAVMVEKIDFQEATVIGNNHHHRIMPLEQNLRHMQWEAGLRINEGAEDGYEEPDNLRLDHEISHHMAHAYSVACQAPFNHGLVVVMDGMGETYRSMTLQDDNYSSDLTPDVKLVPSDIEKRSQQSIFDWREAESVYTFRRTENEIEIKPFLKRFCQEKTPPTLFNHGFENMESVGAIYSRASSHIFGDWNACGKVMGLAPWACHKWKKSEPILHEEPIFHGSLYHDDGLVYNRTLLEGEPLIARTDPDLFTPDGSMKKRYDFDEDIEPSRVALEAIGIAHRVQTDLETTVMDFVEYCKRETGETNLCLAGGVALNSVLNGRLARELGFEQTFIPPYPGDDGIAVGCCAYGLFSSPSSLAIPIWKGPFLPYLGPDISESDLEQAIFEAEPWLEVELVRKDEQRLEMMVNEIASGGVIAWFQGRSEMGPRALGHRSILADPRKRDLVRFINEQVKSRESFRPFAPSVLVEEATDWFELGDNAKTNQNVSPFMSMTAIVHEDKRGEIPAVTHIDGSSRLQTVAKEEEPLYHRLITKFFEKTGVPMVLNTSFNTLPSEPIVETPSDAIRTFLYSMGSIEFLVLGDYVIRRRKADLRSLLGEGTKEGVMKVEPACPQRAGSVTFQTNAEVDSSPDDAEPVTKVCMPDRPMHGRKNEWFELLDELEGEILAACDGTTTLNDFMTEITASSDAEGQDRIDEAKTLLQNIVHRIVRLYEHTLISW